MRAVLTSILWVGFLLRLHDLGSQSFWIDEAYTWGVVVNTTWRSVWAAMLAVSDVSPLPYVLSKIVAPVFGAGEFGLRLPGALLGWLAIPVVYRLGRAMFGRQAGVLAAGFIAFSPFTVWYAQDARPYGLYLFLGAYALWGFYRAQRGQGWTMLVLSSAALYVTHYASALFVYVQVAYVLTQMRRQPLLFRRWAAAQALAVIPVAAWVLAFFSRRQLLTANSWIPPVTPLTILQTCWNFISGDAIRPSAVMAAGLTIVFGLMALGTVHQRKTHPREIQLLWWWLALPLVSVWLLSLRLPAYIDRFFEPAILSVALLLSVGVLTLPTGLRWAMVGVMALGLLAATTRLFIDPAYAKEDWRSVAAAIQRADLPVGVMDAESVLGLVPYISSTVQIEFTPTEEDLSHQLGEGKFVLILRSPHESAHAFAETGAFDPLVEGSEDVRKWLAAHPSPGLEVRNYSGVSLLIIGR